MRPEVLYDKGGEDISGGSRVAVGACAACGSVYTMRTFQK